MRVTRLSLRNFRSYEAEEVRLGPGLTVITGPNGAGKTNLLEALYFACTGRSCKTANEREVVRFGASLTRLVLEAADERGAPARLRVPARSPRARPRGAGAAARAPRPGGRGAVAGQGGHAPRLCRRPRPAQRAHLGDPRGPRGPRLAPRLGRG